MAMNTEVKDLKEETTDQANDIAAGSAARPVSRIIVAARENWKAHAAWAAALVVCILLFLMFVVVKNTINILWDEKETREKLLYSVLKRTEPVQALEWREAFNLITREECTELIEDAKKDKAKK
jgi:hypothetical protein